MTLEAFASTEVEKEKTREQLIRMYQKDFIKLEMMHFAMGAREERGRFFDMLANKYLEIRSNERLPRREALEEAIKRTLKEGEFVLIERVTVQNAPRIFRFLGTKPVDPEIAKLP